MRCFPVKIILIFWIIFQLFVRYIDCNETVIAALKKYKVYPYLFDKINDSVTHEHYIPQYISTDGYLVPVPKPGELMSAEKYNNLGHYFRFSTKRYSTRLAVDLDAICGTQYLNHIRVFDEHAQGYVYYLDFLPVISLPCTFLCECPSKMIHRILILVFNGHRYVTLDYAKKYHGIKQSGFLIKDLMHEFELGDSGFTAAFIRVKFGEDEFHHLDKMYLILLYILIIQTVFILIYIIYRFFERYDIQYI